MRLAAIISAILVLTTPAVARICGVGSVNSFLSDATIIVIGMGEGSASSLPSINGDRIVRVKVIKALKGSVDAQNIEVDASCSSAPDTGPMIVFLESGSEAKYSGVSKSGILPISKVIEPRTGADPREVVIAELKSMAGNPTTRYAALKELQYLDRALASEEAKKALHDSDNSTRLLAVGILADQGSPESLREIVKELNSKKFQFDCAEASCPHHPLSMEIFELCRSIEKIPDSKNLAKEVRPLLKHQHHRIRNSAARALRNQKDPEVVLWLLPALDDSDKRVRYNAMFAICMLEATPGTCPASTRFNEDEAKYIAFARAIASRAGKRK